MTREHTHFCKSEDKKTATRRNCDIAAVSLEKLKDLCRNLGRNYWKPYKRNRERMGVFYLGEYLDECKTNTLKDSFKRDEEGKDGRDKKTGLGQ